MQVRVEIK